MVGADTKQPERPRFGLHRPGYDGLCVVTANGWPRCLARHCAVSLQE